MSGFPDEPHTLLDLHHSDYKPYEARTYHGYSPIESYFKVIEVTEIPKLVYLASPYSHPDDAMRKLNFVKVSMLAAKLASEGHVVLSPITYGHTLVDFHEMPTDWPFWENFCITILSKCDKLLVYKMEGWDKSKGVAAEIEYAMENNIPVEYIEYTEKD
jgi:hypothetical protein